MKNRIFFLAVITCQLLFIQVSSAQAKNPEIEALYKKLHAHFPDIKITEISPSPLPGIYQVTAPPGFYYVTMDGRYVIDGNILDLKENKNLTQVLRNTSRYAAIQTLQDTMIRFTPKKTKHIVTVFTDVDCFYCQKLHREIAEYNKRGIEIRYLAFPRAGPGSLSFKKAEAVWCAEDKKTALTLAKQRKPIEMKTCKNPVLQHYNMGQRVGVHGTPALILESGELISGYVSAERLSKELDRKSGK